MSQDNLVKFQCKECRSINYFSKKNKKVIKVKLEMKKHCRKCGKHTMHKEVK